LHLGGRVASTAANATEIVIRRICMGSPGLGSARQDQRVFSGARRGEAYPVLLQWASAEDR
jgi:hypothetical protein